MPKTSKRVSFAAQAAQTINKDSLLVNMFERLNKPKRKHKSILKRRLQRSCPGNTENKGTNEKNSGNRKQKHY